MDNINEKKNNLQVYLAFLQLIELWEISSHQRVFYVILLPQKQDSLVVRLEHRKHNMFQSLCNAKIRMQKICSYFPKS